MLPSPTLAVPMTSEAAGRGDHVHHVSACCLLFGDAACVPARFGCAKGAAWAAPSHREFE